MQKILLLRFDLRGGDAFYYRKYTTYIMLISKQFAQTDMLITKGIIAIPVQIIRVIK